MNEWMTRFLYLTRPDTRPPVADGWAGAEMLVFPLFDSWVTDRRTDGRTDGRTDKASYRVACPQLKRKRKRKRRRRRRRRRKWIGDAGGCGWHSDVVCVVVVVVFYPPLGIVWNIEQASRNTSVPDPI